MAAPRGFQVWRDYVTDGVPSSGNNNPKKSDIRSWTNWLESLVTSGVLSSGPWFATRAAMTLAYAENTIAIVYNDPIAANNGLYIKVGVSGSGSWTQLTSFLPGYQFVTASPTGASTAIAIVASTSPRLPSGDGVALVTLAIPNTNTGSPVTVSFDGGTALVIKTRTGEDPDAGELQQNDVVAGFVSGSTFRLISDLNSLRNYQSARAWANNDEDVPVPVAMGGDGATTFSAKHWAAKSKVDADRSDEEADRSEAARDIAAGYASDAVSQGNVPIYGTVAGMPALEIPVGINTIRVNGYYAAGDGGGSKLTDVDNGTAPIAMSGGATARNWYIASETLRLRMFGAVGDYNPYNGTGADDTAAIQVAFATASALERTLRTGRGVFYHEGELHYPYGLNLIGQHRNTSRFFVNIDNTMAGSRIEAQHVRIEYVGTVVKMTGTLGPDDGEYGSGLTLSRYYTNGEPIDTRGIVLRGVGYYKAPLSPNNLAHGLNGVGRFAEIDAEGVEVEDFSGSAIHFHWGANAVGVDLPIVETFHPNKLRIENVVARNCGRPFTLSSGYDITLKGVRGINCARAGDIIPGDETDFYANSADKPLVGGVIHISDVVCDGISDTVTGALRVVSIGTSRADDDASTGLGTRRVLFWKNVLIENVLMVGADDVPRAIDLTGACGHITVRNINAEKIARNGIGVRLADTRGNILVDNVAVGAKTGIHWERAWGAKCSNITAAMTDRSGLSGDLIATRVIGNTYTATLAAAVALNDTSITLSAALGGVLNPGDTILVNGNPATVASGRQFRATETVITIEPATFTAASASSVVADQRSIPKMHGGSFSNYDYGATLANCKSVEFVGGEYTDIHRVGISGSPKSGDIERNRFIRGGQRRIDEPSYATRNILLSAGAECTRVIGNECGIDATMIQTHIQTSADTGNLDIKGNVYHRSIDGSVQFASQSSGRLDASQFNDFSRHGSRVDGGATTMPTAWYEKLGGGVVNYHAPALPTQGFHARGSQWIRTTATAGQVYGAICVADGVPGSWVNFAPLA